MKKLGICIFCSLLFLASCSLFETKEEREFDYIAINVNYGALLPDNQIIFAGSETSWSQYNPQGQVDHLRLPYYSSVHTKQVRIYLPFAERWHRHKTGATTGWQTKYNEATYTFTITEGYGNVWLRDNNGNKYQSMTGVNPISDSNQLVFLEIKGTEAIGTFFKLKTEMEGCEPYTVKFLITEWLSGNSSMG